MATPPALQSSTRRGVIERLRNWGALVVAIGSVAWPAFGSLKDDSFPLSTYPMFAAARGRPQLAQMVGLDATGKLVRLNPELLGSSEVLQAKALVERAANAGPRQRAAFCKTVAARVRRAEEQASEPRLEQLELTRGRFDPIAYFTITPEPLEREVLYRCDVHPAAERDAQ
jgi:hypothetical protein